MPVAVSSFIRFFSNSPFFSLFILPQKFETLSQMLIGNGQLLSLLAKEARWYRENKAKCHGAYPFGRASDFSEEILKLRSPKEADALSLLDHLRFAITQIGNTVAFVKLISAAEANHSSGSVTSARSLDGMSYAESPSTTSSNGVTDIQRAGSDLNAVVQEQRTQSRRKSSLLKLLCGDFQRDMTVADYTHMQNFAMLIPALCLNWLEVLQRGKEMMHKQNLTSDVYFVDDGFALGVAFVLSSCDLYPLFDSLHWFAAINHKQDADEKQLRDTKAKQEERERRLAQANKKVGTIFSFARTSPMEDETTTATRSTSEDGVGEDERGALSLSWKMFESRKREMRSLFCTLQCSRSFLLGSYVAS